MAISEPPGRGAIDLRTDVPHPAPIYDYWLGGKDNFAADREAAEAVIAVRPTVVRDIRANRAFLRRVVAWLASQAGIGQFLDIGTGPVPAAASPGRPDRRIRPRPEPAGDARHQLGGARHRRRQGRLVHPLPVTTRAQGLAGVPGVTGGSPVPGWGWSWTGAM